MPRYRIITLVDITYSNPDRDEKSQLKLGQQANFNSLIQAIGLRANVSWGSEPKQKSGSLPLPLLGKANHWIWEFEVEREDVFLADGDSVKLLVDDLHEVPVIDRLNNSVDLHPSMFQSKGDSINIWVSKIN